MNFNTVIFLLFFFFLAVAGVVYAFSSSIFHPSPAVVIATPSASPTPFPNPTVSPEVSPEANIIVTSPETGDTASSPLTVSGQARVFENVIQIRLKENNGKLLAQTIAEAKSPDVGQFGPFEKKITFPKPTDTGGVLEVFSLSAKDGSEINKVVININF